MFTSSQIHKLMGKGRGSFSIYNVGSTFNSYVKEVKRMKLIGRKINHDINSKYTDWGNLCEDFFYKKYLSNEYKLVSDVRYTHPEIKEWSGAPDLINDEVVGDIKCPFTLNSFLDIFDIQSIEDFKRIKPEYYWQLVSNSILTGLPKAEIIAFIPYKKQLDKIREKSEKKNIGRFAFFADSELPYIEKEKSKILNIKRFDFLVPLEDKEILTERVKLAVSLL